jgi:PAS domain S-box-containing protein
VLRDWLAGVPAHGDMLQSVFDHVPAMISYWDLDLRCVFANRAYERWWGVSADALIGMHMSELVGPLFSLNLPYLEAALRGEAQEFEREIPDPAGGPSRHSLASYIPDIVDGVVRGIHVLVTEVSAIKRAELALRESEERFRLTIEEAPIGMALVGLDGRFLRVNRALCEIVGYSADELTGLTFQAITHPDDCAHNRTVVEQLARGDMARCQFGKRYFRKDGRIVDALLNVAALRDRDGALIHFITQIQDVTEQKRAESEQRLLASIGPVFAASLDFEETLARIAELVVRDLADECAIELLATDEEGWTVKAAGRNPRAVALTERLVHHPIDPSRPHLLQRVLETKQGFLLERPSQQTIEAFAQSDAHLEALRAAQIQSLVVVPLVVHGRLIGGIILVSSTPGRIYGPADLRLAEELAHRAALSIENARLYRAAKRATQARDDLLGIVAHDLRSPLTSVTLQAAVLQTGPGEQRAARAIQGIEHSVSRMQRLIQDLLDVAQLDAGKLSVDIARADVRQLLADAVEPQHALASAASLELAVEVHGEGLEVHCDRDRLSQIFENLIGNAIKFTPPGGVITVTAMPSGGDVLFRVRDTGRGVPPDTLPHLFDRFWQANRQAKRSGAGLGLTIVKGLVEAHGGRIWVESTQGHGMSVYFTIPLAAPARCAIAATAG